MDDETIKVPTGRSHADDTSQGGPARTAAPSSHLPVGGSLGPLDDPFGTQSRRRPMTAPVSASPSTSWESDRDAGEGAPPSAGTLTPPQAAAAFAVLVLGGWFLYASHRSSVATPPPAPASTVAAAQAVNEAAASAHQQKVLLLEDPVCKRPVDPTQAQYVLELGSNTIYFDSLDCLNQFKSNPAQYARVKVRVRMSHNDLQGSPSPGASTDPLMSPGASGSPQAPDATGGSARDSAPNPSDGAPPGQETDASAPTPERTLSPSDLEPPAASEPAASSKGAGAIPQRAPADAQPTLESVGDAPSVSESKPAAVPTPQTSKAAGSKAKRKPSSAAGSQGTLPSATGTGAPPAATAPSDNPADLSERINSARRPGRATTSPASPGEGNDAGGGDANGFSLPPSLNSEGPPHRKPASGGQ